MLCCAVFAMKYNGLVDPKNKPFGNLLPFEVQVIITFWTRCFMTNDRRTKINEELTRLPCCLRTGIPMLVAFSFSSGCKRFSSAMKNKPYPRFYGCPHCFRRNTQQVSVSVFTFSCRLIWVSLWETKINYMMQDFVSYIPLRFFLFLVDWYDCRYGKRR